MIQNIYHMCNKTYSQKMITTLHWGTNEPSFRYIKKLYLRNGKNRSNFVPTNLQRLPQFLQIKIRYREHIANYAARTMMIMSNTTPKITSNKHAKDELDFWVLDALAS